MVSSNLIAIVLAYFPHTHQIILFVKHIFAGNKENLCQEKQGIHGFSE
jgi:hypothetical protein